MIPVTPEHIEKIIQEAENAGVPEEKLQELKNHLVELKSGKGKLMMNKTPTGRLHQKIRRDDGTEIIRMADAPILKGDNYIENIDFKPVKPSRASKNLLSIWSKFFKKK